MDGVPCVRVDPEAGEETRAQLDEADLLDRTHEISRGDETLYIPITDAESAESLTGAPVVTYDAPLRKTQTTPDEIVDFHASYERVGEAVVIDEDDPDRARTLADAIVTSDIPATTVLNRASKIRGPERVRDWDLLVGDDTEVVHREYGCKFALDLAKVYFSPRLATERHRVVEQVTAGEHAFDMFAGVGPFAIPFAKGGAEVVATDINDVAIEYLRENAERNGVADSVTAIHGDVAKHAPDYEGWADRIVMNLPHSADEYLDTALTLAGETCTLHYYDIQHDEDPFGPGKRAIHEAAAEADYEMAVETRRVVRSYAPHEENVVLDVRLEQR